MFSSHTPVRDVLVCPWCKLTQFAGNSNLCRRCRKPLYILQVEVPLALIAADGQTLSNLVGNTIRQLRLRRGFSQSTLASKIGTHRTHLSRVEHARQTPTMALVLRAAAALGVEKVLIRVRE
jgi:DNA-binding XRE family transcriptional regulator